MNAVEQLNARKSSGSAALALPVFTLTIFVSAALLFSVQPMFAKMVLPMLGGSPGVWSVAMVVFQSLLLAGYAYAHAVNRWLPGIPGIVLHVFVTLAAAATLPFSIRMTGAPPTDGEMLYVIAIFLTAIGPSFFALSANSPLLQAWFIHTRHASANDPYFLYAASNVGSFLALFAYPFLLEPQLTLGEQRQFWTWGYYVLAALIAVCGTMVARTWRHADAPSAATAAPDDGLGFMRVLGWIALSAIPSGLLVAVTAQISTDVASAPLLWIIPLALYLVTFVIVFQRRPILPHKWMIWLQPLAIAAVIATYALEVVDNLILVLSCHLVAFFIVTMMCHGELVARRPHARNLTVFYLAMSLGGVLGGMFSGLIAPRAFGWVAEYPILLVLSLLCRPGISLSQSLKKPLTWAAGAAVVVALAASLALFSKTVDTNWDTIQVFLVGALLVLALVLSAERLRVAMLIAACFAIVQYFPSDGRARESIRSFFGVHKISESSDGRFRLLAHGTTIHGAQEIRNPQGEVLTGRPEPISYYFERGTIAQAFRAAREVAGGNVRAGVVGLGTGSMACHLREGDDFRFFEIDADVVRIARNTKWFTFLSECGPKIPVIMGDARLTLEKEPDASFDVLLIDAFSSDAIPVHLMTKEAVALYKKKLKPRGILIMHISNRHMELASEVAGVAHANNMVSAIGDPDAADIGANSNEYRYDATVAFVANSEADLAPVLRNKGWDQQGPVPGQRAWTDDYSNILGSIIRKSRDNADDDEDDDEEE